MSTDAGEASGGPPRRASMREEEDDDDDVMGLSLFPSAAAEAEAAGFTDEGMIPIRLAFFFDVTREDEEEEVEGVAFFGGATREEEEDDDATTDPLPLPEARFCGCLSIAAPL